ncbi:hypothetical protein LshimejAT787_0100380 [Lyophyllum shimeji]|uniref:Uncharacterized protein n=1 Tax=Lyophyllum shimeji TaxID=47721 RepID=A0A9P3PCX8_LYOSH|nr:hypothetical protein LshimejAT787_0100380 [Lyophyllum shimeji]
MLFVVHRNAIKLEYPSLSASFVNSRFYDTHCQRSSRLQDRKNMQTPWVFPVNYNALEISLAKGQWVRAGSLVVLWESNGAGRGDESKEGEGSVDSAHVES